MARPRQPIDLIVAKGKKHLSKAEIEERRKQEVKASDDNIEAPSYLPNNLKEEFNKIAYVVTSFHSSALKLTRKSAKLLLKVRKANFQLKTQRLRFMFFLQTKNLQSQEKQ